MDFYQIPRFFDITLLFSFAGDPFLFPVLAAAPGIEPGLQA